MTLIIAEAGVNHNGSEELAIQLIDAAKAAKADIVKFQTFKASNCVTKNAVQADYQTINTNKEESQLAMIKRLELSFDAHHRLIRYCNKVGIEFLSTAFDFESLDFVVNELGLTRLKIPSGEITNAPLVLAHAKTKCDLILSTGMASLSDIEAALGVIAFGFISKEGDKPSISAFREAYFSLEGQQSIKNKVTILHCTTEYPAPLEDINLKAMDTIQNAFLLPVGYSDHSKGILVPIVAVARGATIIEKHFTLDKNMEGPDHKASLDPIELKTMVKSIRETEASLGDGIKGPRPSEIKNMTVARKSLVASKKIIKGDYLSEQNITIKRPGTGSSPFMYWEKIGTKATQNYNEDDFI
jgi:N-acetylneuraminate synthase